MASLVLYGSAVADTTLTTACKMAIASGGVETSKVTTVNGGSGNFAEVVAQGAASSNAVAAIPATPTGHGWIYQPGAGTFALGNWSASIALSTAVTVNPNIFTLRFFKYSAGVYTSIGSIGSGSVTTTTARAVVTFAATSMPATTFTATDFIYIDLWMNDGFGVFGDNPKVYESTTSTAGVVNDVQVTTSNFTASGGGVTHFSIFDGYSGFVS